MGLTTGRGTGGILFKKKTYHSIRRRGNEYKRGMTERERGNFGEISPTRLFGRKRGG